MPPPPQLEMLPAFYAPPIGNAPSNWKISLSNCLLTLLNLFFKTDFHSVFVGFKQF